MHRITTLALSGLLLLGAAACNNTAKTGTEAPDQTNQVGQPPTADKAQDLNKDATSQVRRDQLNADIRAREERNKMAGEKANRSDTDLASEVRSKLEANLPASKLTVESKQGVVTVAGTVPTQPQLARIEPLAKEIYGVKGVVVNVAVAPAQPQS